jgi:hypothetical protein
MVVTPVALAGTPRSSSIGFPALPSDAAAKMAAMRVKRVMMQSLTRMRNDTTRGKLSGQACLIYTTHGRSPA